KTGRRITFEYIMLKDINDREEHAYMLADALKGMICHVNLIPFNDVEGREFQPSSQKQIEHFYGILNKKGIPVSIRRRLGTDIDAACGQLRRRFVDE
ncbi:MAG: rRNA (adenine2503-C2)-methyltransferase, partial [Clostridiales bacterium]|nr:rRNA (adenine2503-C2)-methyltransferase [Clostridiales bacterium]